MSTAAVIGILLTTSLQSVKAIGPGRQFVIKGASSDFACDVYAADTVSATNLVKVTSITGSDVRRSFPNDSSCFLKYTVTAGSLGSGEIRVEGPSTIRSNKVDLSTVAADVSRLTRDRTLVLLGGPAGLRVSVYGAASTGGNFVLIATLVADSTSLTRSNYITDSSAAMKIVVESGTPTAATKIYVSGGEVPDYKAKFVFTSLGTYTVSGQILTVTATGALPAEDGVTPAVGNVGWLPEGLTHVTAKDGGPWEITALGDTTTSAAFVRPSWWQNGQALPPSTEVRLSDAGTLYRNSTWRNFEDSGVIGTDAPSAFPDIVVQQVTLSTGAITVTNVPIGSTTKTSVRFERTAVGGTVTSTIMYAQSGITAGDLSTASVTVQAQIATGGVQASDTSTGRLVVTNW